jgi:hypothetical protein
VFHGGDANGVSLVMEADAVVADAEALDVAFAGVQIAGQRVEDTEDGGHEIKSRLRSDRLSVGQATSRALGFFLAMARSLSAACRGRRVPCSQLRTALGLTFK